MSEQGSQRRRVPKRIAAAIINSLKGGVVPRVGLPYVTVGREHEIEALLHDVDIIREGGASFRFIVGKYGSGKSFLLQTIRNYAMDLGFVVMDADLSPERRLQGSKGQGLATYKELVRNMATKTRPTGGALTLILDRWISSIEGLVAAEGISPDETVFEEAVRTRIQAVVGQVGEMVHGFDFARLLQIYYQSYVAGDDEAKGRVIRWFRGEYATKTEARRELGVGIVIGDDDWYEYVKLFAYFLRQAGYAGLLMLIDELVNIYKVPNAITRQNNYEKILTMYNDTLQGKAHFLGIIMCGTPQAIEDRRRGVYSYEALRSRLAQGRFGSGKYRDLMAPVIHLEPLSYEEMLVLIEKLQDIHALLFGYESRLSEGELVDFVKAEYSRVGAELQITPREVIRDFIELLDILYQHPDADFATVLGQVQDLSAQAHPSQRQSSREDLARTRPDVVEFTL